MQPELVVPGVYRLAFEIGQVYLGDRPDGVTVIDSSIAGSAPAILDAVRAIGRQPEQVTEIVLTHYHDDHRGSAAELAAQTGATVIAHRIETPVIRGEQPQAPPVLLDFERPIFDAVVPKVPPASPVDVIRMVEDGEALAGGGLVVHVPGHTAGSIALLAPAVGVLFTGDTIAEHNGAPILGVFNVDRAEAIRSLRKQATLDFGATCFGHGEPVIGGASARIRALAETL